MGNFNGHFYRRTYRRLCTREHSHPCSEHAQNVVIPVCIRSYHQALSQCHLEVKLSNYFKILKPVANYRVS